VIVVVGHGPSVSNLGAVIDSHTVVRLKGGLRGDPKDWGTRTDYLCARSLVFDLGKFSFWHFSDESRWLDYFAKFRPRRRKPSTGLCAVFCAIDRLAPKEIGLIGFDAIFNKLELAGHDTRAEHECLHSLGINIIDLEKAHRSLC
jgi:hypothetical protein